MNSPNYLINPIFKEIMGKLKCLSEIKPSFYQHYENKVID